MPKAILSHIVAVSKNHVIGNQGKLPWHIPEDLKYFFSKTKGKILIMGRKTFESLGKALPNRLNIVLTSQKNFSAKEALVFSNWDQAFNYASQASLLEKYGREIFIGGGGEIYKQTLPLMDKLYVTRIHKNYKGDAFYPKIPESQFELISEKSYQKPEPFSFLVYKKINSTS